MYVLELDRLDESSSVIDTFDDDSVRGMEAEESELVREDEEMTDAERHELVRPEVDKEEKESSEADMRERAKSEELREDTDVVLVGAATVSTRQDTPDWLLLQVIIVVTDSTWLCDNAELFCGRDKVVMCGRIVTEFTGSAKRDCGVIEIVLLL